MNENHISTEFRSASNNKNKSEKELNSKSATIIFLSYSLTQLFVGFFSGLLASIFYLVIKQGAKTREGLETFISSLQLPFSLLAMFSAAAVMILLSLRYGKSVLKNRSNFGIAWVSGSYIQIIIGFFLGIIIAIGYILLAVYLFPPDPEAPLSPLLKLVYSSGSSRYFWIFLLLFFAPPVEEFLFRGVMFSGYAKTYGTLYAAIISTSLFVLLHTFEAIYYLPAFLGITGIGILTLLLRLKFKALGPPISAHFGYNLVIVIIALTSISQG